MPDPATLAQAFRNAVPLFTRYLDGFDDSNRTTQAPGLANHAAWTLGHLALYLHRGAEAFDGRDLPEADFVIDAHQGDAERFGTETICYGSNPTDDPSLYPSWSRCLTVFDNACDRYARAIADTTPDQLAGEAKWGTGTIPGHALAIRHVVHMSTHTGQLIDLRRALGMQKIVG